MVIFENAYELGKFATFVPNKNQPVFNWLYYKEGFSKEIVEFLIKKFEIKKGQTVFDPFCGVGTTMLACKALGINSIGFDVNTVALFAAKVKCQNYKPEELKLAVKKLLKQKFQKPNYKVDMKIAKKAFSKFTLEDIFFFKQKIFGIFDEQKIQDFLLLALVNTSTKCTYAEKQGGCIRINKKRHIPPFRPMLKKVSMKMIKGYEKFLSDAKEQEIPLEKISSLAQRADARQLPLDNESIDDIITSPPYLNKIEYTNVYAIEQYLFFGEASKPAVRSYVGEDVKIGEEADADVKDIFEDKHQLPEIAYPYFKDMNSSLSEMSRVLKPGGKAGVIIGNGCFPDGVVESDELLAELAEKVGFKVEKIIVLNKRWCMRERVIKVAPLRESLIILEK